MPYWLAPDKGGAKAYALLRDALAKSDRVGIATFVMRGSGIIGPPASDVFFRPEEIHVVSRVRPVVIPARGRQVRLADNGLGEGAHRVVSHVQPERLRAVEAAGIDLHVLTGE